jgi:glycogen(starch) synthase
MPSRADSFPLVALEAGLMSRPLVASRVGGLPEIVVHERTGLLVDSEDVVGFAAAATRLLADSAAAVRMGRAARRRVDDVFSWTQHVSAYDSLYHAVAAAPSAAAELSR